MFRLINIIYDKRTRDCLYAILDTSDFEVDIVSSGDIKEYIYSGLVISGIDSYNGRVQSTRVQGGVLPPYLNRFKLEEKSILLLLQAHGVPLHPFQRLDFKHGVAVALRLALEKGVVTQIPLYKGIFISMLEGKLMVGVTKFTDSGKVDTLVPNSKATDVLEYIDYERGIIKYNNGVFTTFGAILGSDLSKESSVWKFAIG